jgi:hypothetical protein
MGGSKGLNHLKISKAHPKSLVFFSQTGWLGDHVKNPSKTGRSQIAQPWVEPEMSKMG